MRQSKPRSLSRRTFIKSAAVVALGAPYVVSASVLGADGARSPSDRIQIASIGFRAQGGGHLRSLLNNKDVRITALCDVDQKVLDGGLASAEKAYGEEKAGGTFKGTATTRDFREIMARPDVDAVVIATPDHWHGCIAVAAAKAGKDIYCEKPMSLTIAGGRAMVEAVNRYGRVFQTGSQQRSGGEFRQACELVRNGYIGKLKHVEVGIPGNNRKCDPTWEPQPVPPELDYEMWLGPAPWAPYHVQRCHYDFRFLLAYSGGQVTNWGAHYLDIAQWGIGADDSGPVEVQGNGEFPRTGLFTTATKVDFTCTYANGVTLQCKTGSGYTKFVGDAGEVYVTRGRITTTPASLAKQKMGATEIHLYAPHGSHMTDFLYCMRTRERGSAHVEIGHRSASVCHLGNIAMLLNRTVKWDPKAEQFIGDDDANRMISRAPRAPWALYG